MAALIAISLSSGIAFAQDQSFAEEGAVVGTAGLNHRECSAVAGKSKGLAQLEDPILVTGPEQDGHLPMR